MRDTTRPTRRKIITGTLAATVAAPAFIGAAKAQQKITWRLQTIWPKASSSFIGSAGVLASELEKRTNGRFRLEPLAAGEIAQGPEVYNVVRRGVVQMGATTPSYNLDEATLMGQYAGVPGTLRASWELMHVCKNLGLEEALNEELRPKGVFYMADKVLPAELILKRPIEPGENLGGLKVSSSGNVLKFLGALGFAAQYVNGAELYQSLATGVIDGAQWGGAQGGLSLKLWEIAKVHMMPPLAMTHNVYVINQAAYDKLPDDLRATFTALVEERYYRRSLEYEQLEAVALRTGIDKMGVSVGHFPEDVLKRMTSVSQDFLEVEMAKGPKSREVGGRLQQLMKDLGYL